MEFFLRGIGIKEKDYFKTGSTVYGGSTKNSDVDICFHISYRPYILQKLGERGISHEEGDYFKCEYAYFSNCEVNFIFLGDREFPLWKKATMLMKLFPVQTDKEKRIQLFEMLKLTARLFDPAQANPIPTFGIID